MDDFLPTIMREQFTDAATKGMLQNLEQTHDTRFDVKCENRRNERVVILVVEGMGCTCTSRLSTPISEIDIVKRYNAMVSLFWNVN